MLTFLVYLLTLSVVKFQFRQANNSTSISVSLRSCLYNCHCMLLLSADDDRIMMNDYPLHIEGRIVFSSVCL